MLEKFTDVAGEGAVAANAQPNFSQRVYAAVRQVPKGRVTTYGTVARLIGSPRCARYVGFSLHVNPEPGNAPGATPCHRVVFKDGSLATNFGFGGAPMQRALLEAEGVTFTPDGRVDMARHYWAGPEE